MSLIVFLCSIYDTFLVDNACVFIVFRVYCSYSALLLLINQSGELNVIVSKSIVDSLIKN